MMTNPFSTTFWTAGTIPFRFPDGMQNIDTLLEQARRHRICQIVGPHGSGKSTLLSALAKRLEQKGEHVQRLNFNDRQRRIARDASLTKDILLVDGFEQLRLSDKMRLFCRANCLFLTAHRPVWLVPILFRTQPQFAVFVHIVQRMLPQVSERQLRETYKRSDGNFRRAFFELYDHWEENKSDLL